MSPRADRRTVALTPEQRARKNARDAAYQRARTATHGPRVLSERERELKRQREHVRSQWKTVVRRFGFLIADLERPGRRSFAERRTAVQE